MMVFNITRTNSIYRRNPEFPEVNTKEFVELGSNSSFGEGIKKTEAEVEPLLKRPRHNFRALFVRTALASAQPLEDFSVRFHPSWLYFFKRCRISYCYQGDSISRMCTLRTCVIQVVPGPIVSPSSPSQKFALLTGTFHSSECVFS